MIHDNRVDDLFLDRSIGVVLASAAGDALGAGYEFGPALPLDTPVVMKGGGSFNWSPGEWTDDTQLAVAVLAAIPQRESQIESVEARFRAWYNSSPADVGIQTRSVLSSPGSLVAAAAQVTAARPNRSSGNGSLMRTGPVALAAPGDPAKIAELAVAVSELTHPHPDCVDACVLWSLAIDHTIHCAPEIQGDDNDGTWDWATTLKLGLPHIPRDRQARWNSLIDEAATAQPGDFTNNGWVVHAFQAALAAISSTQVPGQATSDHIRRAIESAVRCGGDTDTVAAIAGSLIGARYGASAIPVEWLDLLHGRQTYDDPPLSVDDLTAMTMRAVV